MAGESPRLIQRAQAAARLLDDEALAALANKGLVRRAKKDVEAAPPQLTETPDGLSFQVEDCTVTMADIPAQARCTCPATGGCRHILAAILFLRESPATEASATKAPTTSPAYEILKLSDDEIQKAAGTALVRRAKLALAMGLPVEFEDSKIFRIRFPSWNLACTWQPGGGLAGMICSCHAAMCEHRVAGVLAFQAAAGQRTINATSFVLDESAGAPRSREQVRASVGVVLREMIALGLSRLSESTEKRLRTLAVSAHGVDLPRLERLLRTLADEAASSLNRNALATSRTFLETASRLEAMCVALARPTADLVGVHRSRYEKVGDIELVGLGARQWRTRSGYVGLTVYFWDRSRKDWATWTESRPVTVPDFDPVVCYRSDGLWNQSPWMASRNVVRAAGAWRNRGGRLSGRPSTRSFLVGPSDIGTVPGMVERWSELAPRVDRLFAGGLRERNEQDEIVLLRPKTWDAALFDPIEQELRQSIVDEDGRMLLIVLPHLLTTADAITILERHDPTTTTALLGLLRMHRGRPAVEPITLVGNTLTHLTLDGSGPTKTPATKSPTKFPEDADGLEDPEEGLDEEPSESLLGRLFAEILERLESIAEAGVRSAPNVSDLERLARKSDAAGLVSLARPLKRLADQLEQLRKSVEANALEPAETLLRCYYLVRLAVAEELVATSR